RGDVDHIGGDSHRAAAVGGEVAANHPVRAEYAPHACGGFVVDAALDVELLSSEHAAHSRGLHSANGGLARQPEANELANAADERVERRMLIADDAVRERERAHDW